MRHDLKLLWVDDLDMFYEENKEIIDMHVEDLGLTIEIVYIQNAKELIQRIERENQGFKTFDLFFIDYYLSYELQGTDVINKLRDVNIDSDILFYSSKHEAEIREAVTKNLGSFEGVYIASRDNFSVKSINLIKKTSKRLSSISNIRGLLTDQTSENDFIVFSYILDRFPKLKDDKKAEIKHMILDYMKKQQEEFNHSTEEEIRRIEESDDDLNINRLFKLRGFLFPLDLKYKIFQEIININNETAFNEYPLDVYKADVTGLRNKLAHKKLVVCESRRHLIYCDNLNQYNERICPSNCSELSEELSEESYRISIEQWEKMRKKVVSYGKCFDAIFDKIKEDTFEQQLVEEKSS